MNPVVSIVFRRSVSAVLLGALVALSAGCTTTGYVTLREKPRNPLLERLQNGHSGYSSGTQSVLTVAGVPANSARQIALEHVRRMLKQAPTPDRLHAAAEISYLLARDTGSQDRNLAMELYVDAAQYAWQYLAGTHDGTVRDPTAERHRPVAEIYNSGVEAFLRELMALQRDERLTEFQLPLTKRRIVFEVPQPSPWLQPDQVGDIEFVSDYEIRRLRNRHRTDGVGVPLIIQRRRPIRPTPAEKYYLDGLRFPATVVLRFPSPADQRNGAPVRLQAWDPRDSESIMVGTEPLPLETDLSTPLARFLSNPNLEDVSTFALLWPDRATDLRGLYMVQPYDPDRIPVLMVHGLWSSPMTWMEMFNDLQSDPVLRKHYQFWFYLYPTGEPVPFSLADLRDELNELRQRCDPQQENENLRRMVLVGHSMGGLLSYLMTVDSGDRLWKSVSGVPVAELSSDRRTTNEIRRVFFFRSDPDVDRIVTIASPFRGSSYANRVTRWLGRTLISLPGRTLEVTRLLTGLQEQRGADWKQILAPQTSLDSLARRSAVVRLISETSVPDDIAHHNIVGVCRGWSPKWWTDGIVTYRSAHRADADSEKIVRAGHSHVHRHPDAIEEVRAILHEHLRTTADRLRVIPVRTDQRDPDALAPGGTESFSEPRLSRRPTDPDRLRDTGSFPVFTTGI